MNDQFKRIIELVRRTGDRLVVTDPDGREPVIIMDLDEYESMLEAMGIGDSPYFDEDLPYGNEIPPELLGVDEADLEPIDEPDPMLREAFPVESAKLSEEFSPEEGAGDDEQFYLEPIE
ncbi:MAG: hypothetical protein ABIG32_03740 [Candidatus Uhrbacteria bacterium]